MQALRERIADIHPGCAVDAVEDFVEPGNWPALLPRPVDALIDACDQVRAKAALAAWALRSGVPLVCVGAAGGKRLPQAVEVGDLAEVTHDPLLASLRQRLRRTMARARQGRIGLRCVFSREPVRRPDRATTASHRRQPELPRLRLERHGDRDLRHGRGGEALAAWPSRAGRGWPTRIIIPGLCCRRGSLAQLVEQRTFNPLVAVRILHDPPPTPRTMRAVLRFWSNRSHAGS